MPDDLDLAALRRVAEASIQRTAEFAGHDGSAWWSDFQLTDNFNEEDAAHIAAFSPRVALAILLRLEAAERVISALCDPWGGMEHVHDDVREAVRAWRATQQETPDAR